MKAKRQRRPGGRRRKGARMTRCHWQQVGPSLHLDDNGDPVPPPYPRYRLVPGPPEPPCEAEVLDEAGWLQRGPSCDLDEAGDPIPPKYVRVRKRPARPERRS